MMPIHVLLLLLLIGTSTSQTYSRIPRKKTSPSDSTDNRPKLLKENLEGALIETLSIGIGRHIKHSNVKVNDGSTVLTVAKYDTSDRTLNGNSESDSSSDTSSSDSNAIDEYIEVGDKTIEGEQKKPEEGNSSITDHHDSVEPSDTSKKGGSLPSPVETNEEVDAPKEGGALPSPTETDETKDSPKEGDSTAKANGHNDVLNEESHDCKRDKSFNTTVLVEHDGVDMHKDPKEEELEALAKKFAETFNKMNAPKPERDRCDRNHRRVEYVDLQAMGGFERVMEDDSVDMRRIGLYHVTVSCHGHGCDRGKDAVLFDREPKHFKRKLSEKRGHYKVGKDSSLKCNCHGKHSEYRSPTVEEFAKEFNDSVSDLFDQQEGSKIRAQSATAVFELQEIPCQYNDDNDDFDTEVFVDYVGLDDVDIDSDMTKSLEKSFRYSYNDLANLFCDPLNRHVQKVKVDEEKIKRRLGDDVVVTKKKKKRRRLRMRVKGKCRGCRKKTPLFNDGATRRALMSALFEKGDSAYQQKLQQSLPVYNKADDAGQLDLSFHRILEEGSHRCFCSRYPSVGRAPNTEEFAFWHNMKSEVFTEGVEIVDVFEIPK